VTFDLSGAPAALDETRQRRVLLPTELPPSLELGGGHAFRPVHTLAGATMGTYWRARLVERNTAHANDAAQANAILTRAFDEVVARMSPWEPESDLARFARTPPGEWFTLSPETAQVLARALEVAALTDGAYSPALGEVTELLGFGPGDPAVRHSIDSPQVRAARTRADYRRLEFDVGRGAVRQRNTGDGSSANAPLHIDLCSIAKGYAVDLASEQLYAAGWHHHFIEIGGEARGRGCKPNGQPWWCYLETPATTDTDQNTQSEVPSSVAGLCELAVATSGNAHHHFEDEASGKLVGHILRPEDFEAQSAVTNTTGSRAAENASLALHSVTVFASTCMEADAWATALYALGPERGLPLAETQQLAARWLCSEQGSTPALREIATTQFQRLID